MKARDRSSSSTARRDRIACEVETYLARGGHITKADPGRRNPVNEDRNNTFLFLTRNR